MGRKTAKSSELNNIYLFSGAQYNNAWLLFSITHNFSAGVSLGLKVTKLLKF